MEQRKEGRAVTLSRAMTMGEADRFIQDEIEQSLQPEDDQETFERETLDATLDGDDDFSDWDCS